ncbi:coiled-coil domain-containing protein 158-like isoform X2 [Hypanus sabinus]|uniref:coiled-coil domain-containing protein 158-like isoform X2 n=1 Tax=Hypanus sabinus TaxID=79690 RepID=UPI0028C3D257|nr:coiled-coil domain-containing protein 158-like isoform X2 [Hypanus sabinus]
MSTVLEPKAERQTATGWSRVEGKPLTTTSLFNVSESIRSREGAAGGHLSSPDSQSCRSSLHASESGNKALTSCKYNNISTTERSSKNLEELRKELERHTKETKKLQEELEFATKLTMDKCSLTFNEGRSCSLDEISTNHNDKLKMNRSFTAVFPNVRSPYRSSILQTSISKTPRCRFPQTTKYDVDVVISRKSSPSSGTPIVEKSLEDCVNEGDHEQSKDNIQQSVIDLQSKLQELQSERDSLMNLKLKESQNQGVLISKLHSTVQELETVNRMRDETVQGTNTQIEQLKKKIEEQLDYLKTESQSKTELLLKQQEERIEQLKHEHQQELSVLTEKVNRSRSLASSFQNQVEAIQEQARNQSIMYSRQLTDLESTVCHLRTELREARRMYEDKIEDLQKIIEESQSEVCKTRKERDEFRQEVETMNCRIQQLMADSCKVEEDLKVAKEQNQKLWDRGTNNCISIENLQNEIDCKTQDIQRLDGVIKSLKEQCQYYIQYQASADEQRNEDQQKISALVNQYETCREQLCKTGEELNKKKQQIDKTEAGFCQLKESLKERERCLENAAMENNKLQLEIEDKNQKIQRMKIAEESICDQFEEAVRCIKEMQNENDSLKQELSEKGKMLTVLRQEMENIAEMTSQQSSASEALQAERKQLQKEVDCQKQKMQELKTELEHKDAQMQELQAYLSELEREKIKLVNSATEHISELGELLQEKEELATELRGVQTQMGDLKEEYDNLQRSYACKTKEYEWSTNKLKAQLKSVQDDLDQSREALKVLEGADTHAMKIAMGMQKQITAKRGQIDKLQSKVQFLEETLENSEREKCYLKEEKVRLTKELACITSERNKIVGELDTTKSQEKCLREKLMRTESSLEKELQGPNFTTCTYSSARVCSPSVRVNQSSNQPSSQYLPTAVSNTCGLRENLNSDLNNVQMDHKNTVCEGCNKSSHINCNECEEEQTSRNMPAADDVNTDDRKEQRTQDSLFRNPLIYSSEVKEPFNIDNLTCSADHSLQTGGPCYTSSKWETPPERSPVSSLLTGSVPQCENVRENSPFCELCDSGTSYVPKQCAENDPHFQDNSGEQSDAAEQGCKNLQNKLDDLQNLVEDLHLKNHEISSMIRDQEKRIKRVKDKEKILKK